MKLDIFNHIFPKIFYDKMMKVNPDLVDIGKRVRGIPVLYDLDARFRCMDEFDDYAQILCLRGDCQKSGQKDCGESITVHAGI